MRRLIVHMSLLLAIGQAIPLGAQPISVRGTFTADSAKIGEHIMYSLAATYPAESIVLFPDSTFDFQPFEYISKRVFTTQTRGGISYDSAVYTLTTFEIDPRQLLRLPVFVVGDGDSTRYADAADTMIIRQLVRVVPPDSIRAAQLPLKTETHYLPVQLMLNYPLWFLIGGSVLIVMMAVWLIFGKSIRRRFRVKRLQKSHERFIRLFNDHLDRTRAVFDPRKTESTLSVWKKYMEQLESRPFTKLTTRETVEIERDPRLGEYLRTLDRAIYGHETPVVRSFESLRTYAEKKFNKKLLEILNG